MSSPPETIKSYDQSATNYAESRFGIDLIEQRNRFLDLLPGAALPLLDLGCGPGRDTKHLLEKNYRVIGADLSEGMLSEARRRVPQGQFVQADMLKLPFAEASFGGIWCCAALLHLPRALAAPALAEMFRVLGPGGALFLAVQRGQGEIWREDSSNNLRFFFTYFLPSELWNLVLEAGFEPQAIAENFSGRGQTQSDGSPVRWINLYAKR